MIYFDNAASSFPKPIRVLEETYNYIKHNTANPGRSGHLLSMEAAEKVFLCREQIAKFIGFPKPERVCFTLNATHALNIAIKGLIKEKCHVIISDLEHNSVIRPLIKALTAVGGRYSVYDTSRSFEDELDRLVEPDTRLVITTLSSNVTGKTVDAKEIAKVSKKYSLKVIADSSQFLGHRLFDLKDAPFDVLCSAGHKALFGLQGVGFMVVNDDELYETILEGGSGSNSLEEIMPAFLPERFEAGTLPTPSIISLGAGIDFLRDYGMMQVERKIDKLTELAQTLLKEIDGITVYGCENGICSFNIEGYSSAEIGNYLNDNSIYVRTGLHCSPLIHKKLGIDTSGSVRASFSVFNTASEIEKFALVIKRLKK